MARSLHQVRIQNYHPLLLGHSAGTVATPDKMLEEMDLVVGHCFPKIPD